MVVAEAQGGSPDRAGRRIMREPKAAAWLPIAFDQFGQKVERFQCKNETLPVPQGRRAIILEGATEAKGIRCVLRVVKDGRSRQWVKGALRGEEVILCNPHVLAIDFNVRIFIERRQNRIFQLPLHTFARLNTNQMVRHCL